MNLIIAHVPNDSFDLVRSELHEIGVGTTTISEVHVSGPQSTRTLRYRRATLQTHLQPALKLECVASDEQSPAIVDLLRRYTVGAGTGAQWVAVLELNALYEAAVEDDAFPNDPWLVSALQ